MKNPLRWMLLLLSCGQAYLCYLLHYHSVSFGYLDWLIGTYSMLVYIIVLPIVGVVEAVFGWEWYESRNWVFPHLRWQAWIFSVLIFVLLNQCVWRGCLRIYRSKLVARFRASIGR